jgi:hypothetical protein
MRFSSTLFVYEVALRLVLGMKSHECSHLLYYLPSLYILSRPVALLMKVLFIA